MAASVQPADARMNAIAERELVDYPFGLGG